MLTPILTTKLFIPPSRPKVVDRPHLVERLNAGLDCKLTLISAPAGFGKTTLVSEWLAGATHPVAWLSLDEGDNDLTRFLIYLVSALQTINANVGTGALGALQSPQPPSSESILSTLLNEISTIPDRFIFVLDDYHLLDARPIDDALSFLLDHLPPQMHLIVITREDPILPLPRLRVRGQLNEVRATDLRFNPTEAAGFLNQAMGLDLSADDVAALETRTEGWIAGLQLAAISMQGLKDTTRFIESFTGSHHFVLDYLVEEVLQQQTENIQAFLLQTSILDRFCGPLCDALTLDSSTPGQDVLSYLEHANLFTVPLDDERCWYRYHHLFADLLKQRLLQSGSVPGEKKADISELHIRASTWYENNGLEIEAFQHAAAANDIERAERLIEGDWMPLHFRGGVAPVLNWLRSLPATVLDAWPSLWTSYASTLLVAGQATGIEQKLAAAKAAIQNAEPGEKTQDLMGRVAAIRATLAATNRQTETIIEESNRALELLHPDNLPFRTFTMWKLGYAYQLQGDRTEAAKAYKEAISIGQTSGNVITTILATMTLGSIQEAENQLYQAAESYRGAIEMFKEQPLPFACQGHLGLAHILYEWNDKAGAHEHGLQSLQLAQQADDKERVVPCQVFLARMKLAQGDLVEASAILSEAERLVQAHNFDHHLPEIAAVQVLILIHQDDLAAASEIVEMRDIPLSRARVYMAQGNASAALKLLKSYHRQIDEKGRQDERLKLMLLQSVALHANNQTEKAMRLLAEALALAEPGGFVRVFVDEGEPMARLLLEATFHGIMPDYAAKLLGAFKGGKEESEDGTDPASIPLNQPLIETLSQRELEILQLIAEGLSNQEIGERLFLALSTVKGHNRNIFGKLGVQRRTEAIARARELGLL